jgi:hypothetical protein
MSSMTPADSRAGIPNSGRRFKNLSAIGRNENDYVSGCMPSGLNSYLIAIAVVIPSEVFSQGKARWACEYIGSASECRGGTYMS